MQAKVNGIELYLKSLNELVEIFPEKSIELNTRIQFLKSIVARKSISISDDSYVLFFVLNKNQKVESLVDYEYKVEYYDKDKNLIGYAKTAKPVRKTEDRQYTFKLKLDL